MKIGILNWPLALDIGGIQYSGSLLAQAMCEKGHKVYAFYKFHEKRKPLFPPANEMEYIPLLFDIHPQMQADDTFFCCDQEKIRMLHLDVFLILTSDRNIIPFVRLLSKVNTPLIIGIRSNPEIISTARMQKDEFFSCLTAADAIQVFSKKFIDFFPEYLQKKCIAIPNTLDGKIKNISPRNGENKILLGAGRFIDDVKQFSLLIEAFAMISQRVPQWRLVICGDGKDKVYYKTLIKKYALKDKVTLPGMVSTMDSYYEKADLFCMPSKFEGFGRVTLEANSYGVPAVGFAGCSGTNEIIAHNETGFLAEEMTAACLATYLEKLMKDDILREDFGKNAHDNSLKYSPSIVNEQWEKLFLEVSAYKGNSALQKIMLDMEKKDRNDIIMEEILQRDAPLLRYNTHTIDKIICQIEKYRKNKKELEKKIKDKKDSYLYRLCFPLRMIREKIQRDKNSTITKKISLSGISDNTRKNPLIISLTTYPKRIKKIDKTIISLLSQSLRPNKIILWISSAEFKKDKQYLLQNIAYLKDYGLTIHVVPDNIGSYLKLIPALRKYPDCIHVTADDDVYYDPLWLQMLYETHLQYPEEIICHRAHKISLGSNSTILPYTTWKKGITSTLSSFYNFPTGVGGILYPVNCLYRDVLEKNKFMNLTPKADDIWFWAMAVLNHKKIRVVENGIVECPKAFPSDSSSSLYYYNNNQAGNDLQMRKICEAYPEVLTLLKSNIGNSSEYCQSLL